MDDRLLELRRAWECSGSLEDEVAYLRTRVQVGDLPTSRLELAAYCGDEGANLALENPDLAAVCPRYQAMLEASGDDFAAWFVGVSHWGRRAALEATLHCLRLVRSDAALAYPGAQALYSTFMDWCRGHDPRRGAECLTMAKALFGQLEAGLVPVESESFLWTLASATTLCFREGRLWEGTPQLVAQHASCGVETDANEEAESLVLRVVSAALSVWALTGD
ncbi:MAG: hypothetical protein R3F62_14750 [Planctomycetota bacterium]